MRRIAKLEDRVRILEERTLWRPSGKLSYAFIPRLSYEKKQELIDDLHQFATDALKNRDPQSLAVLPDILKYLMQNETET